jgi:ABC-type multidrug transport system fused ATPase/permease subunit
MLMQAFLAHLEDPGGRPKSHAYLCVIAMFACGLVSNVLAQRALFVSRHISFQSRSIFVHELCLKALHRDSKRPAVATQAGEDNSRSGRLMNLLTSDARTAIGAVEYVTPLFQEFVAFVLGLVLLYRLLGPSMWAGIATMVVTYPMHAYLGKRIYALYERSQKIWIKGVTLSGGQKQQVALAGSTDRQGSHRRVRPASQSAASQGLCVPRHVPRERRIQRAPPDGHQQAPVATGAASACEERPGRAVHGSGSG